MGETVSPKTSIVNEPQDRITPATESPGDPRKVTTAAEGVSEDALEDCSEPKQDVDKVVPTLRTGDDFHDRGYAWVVMFAAFFLSMMCSGTFVSYGVFLPEFVEYFRVGKAQAAVVGSLGMGIGGLLGIVLGPIVQRFGCRRVVLFACLLTSTGIAVSAATDHLYVLYVTHGLMPGVGLGCYNICTMLSVMNWFDRRRSLALGVNTGGLSLGIFLIPQLNRYLIDQYTWKGALLIYGGCNLHGLVAGALLRPPPKLKQMNETLPMQELHPSENVEQKSTERTCDVEQEGIKDTKNGRPVTEAEGRLLQCKEEAKEVKTRPGIKCPTNCNTVFDITILKNVKVVLLYLFMYASVSGHFIPYIFIPARLMQYHIEKTKATLVVSIMGLCSGIGRPLTGLLGDYLKPHRALIMTVSSVAVGTICAASYVVTDYTITAVIFGMAGALSAGYVALHMAVLGDILPHHKLPQGTGMLLTFFGVATISAPPIAGYIVDYSGDYATPFLFFGLLQIIGGALSTILFLLQRRGHHRQMALTKGSHDQERGFHGNVQEHT